MKTFDIIKEPFPWDDLPKEVKEGLEFENGLLTDYDHHRILAGIQTEDFFEARRFLDTFYAQEGSYEGQLAHPYYKYSRGNPNEFRFGSWWVICGFDYD